MSLSNSKFLYQIPLLKCCKISSFSNKITGNWYSKIPTGIFVLNWSPF